MFYGRDQSKLSILADQPFFDQTFENFSWIFLKISRNIFSKLFWKKCLIFFEIFGFLGSFLLAEKIKNKQTNKRPTDRPYLAGLSARKTGLIVCFFGGLMGLEGGYIWW